MKRVYRVQMSLYILLFLLVYSSFTNAQSDDSIQVFGEFTIHYTTVNSTLIPPEIAKLHGLVRAGDQTLVNISVQKTSTGESLAADVSVTAKNLMQQVKKVKFKKIVEQDAIYYLGVIKHSNREVFHLDVTVNVEGQPAAFHFLSTKKLYTEES